MTYKPPHGLGVKYYIDKTHISIICLYTHVTMMKKAISARERALCQLTVCFEFQSRRERSFQVTTENLKVAFAQLCNELKGCNFTVL